MSSLSLYPDWLGEYQECIDSQLKSQFTKFHSPLDASAFEALSGGRRLRATLSLLWCEALCGDYKRASEIAAAYELAHHAALIQDDIMDRSAIKRGKTSLPIKYGTSGAILTANALLFLAPRLISEFGYKSGDAVLVSKLLDLFSECYRSSSLGEYLDLELAKAYSVSEKDYEEMIRLKTGSLIGAASASGALIGQGDSKFVSAAYDYGESLGVAYQVQDDVLDIFGDEVAMGKPVFNDIANGKKSLAIIRFLNVCNVEGESQFIKGILETGSESTTAEKISRTRELLLQYGCDSFAKNFGAQYVRRAEDSLKILPDSVAKKRLLEITSLLAARNY